MRLGKFKMNRNFATSRRVVRVLRVLEFIPTRVELLFEQDCFEYIGISPCFDYVQDGCMANEYSIIIDGHEADFSVSVINLTENKQ